MIKINKKSGAASLFLVIFASLLFMTIALSYVGIMLRDQQQATAIDLSQSAYDAALSGVEDAKVLLSRYYSCQQNSSEYCNRVRRAVESKQCDSVARGLGDTSSPYKETFIGSNSIGSSSASGVAGKIDQAYTCNKIAVDTSEYKADLDEDKTKVVPLFSKKDFNRVIISWHQSKDQPLTNSNPGLWNVVAGDVPLLPKSNTTKQKIPMLRMQYISDNDDHNKSSFLVPVASGLRKFQLGALSKKTLVRCSTATNTQGYYCTATIEVPETSRSLLVLRSPYRDTSYKVNLYSESEGNWYTREFDGVQPKVDVTARANDRFRRVEARLQLGGDFNYPGAAMAVEGGICKKFTVTKQGDFKGHYSCP